MNHEITTEMRQKAEEARKLGKERVTAILKGYIAGYTVQQGRRLQELARHNPNRVPVFEKVYKQKATLRQCLNMRCLDCACWQPREVTLCTVTSCSLYYVRPYQVSDEEKAELLRLEKAE